MNKEKVSKIPLKKYLKEGHLKELERFLKRKAKSIDKNETALKKKGKCFRK